MKLIKQDDKYILYCKSIKEEQTAKEKGFFKHATLKQWFTISPEIAKNFIQYVGSTDIHLLQELDQVEALDRQRLINRSYIDYDEQTNTFIYTIDYKARDYANDIGFVFNWDIKKWQANDYTVIEKSLQDNRKFTDLALKEFENYKLKHQRKVAESLNYHSDFYVPCREGKDYKPFQKSAIEYIDKRNGTALLADFPGTGKTPTSIGYMNLRPQNLYAIVCSVNAIDVWRNHIEDWLIEKYQVHILRKEFPSPYNPKSIFIVNYEQLHKYVEHLKKAHINMIIADECHRVLRHKSRQGKSFYSLVKNIPKKLYTTGTPLQNYMAEAYYLLNSLGFSDAQNRMQYNKLYCNDGYGHFGKQYASNVERFNTTVRKELMIRREKIDILPELPEKLRAVYRPTFHQRDLDSIKKQTALTLSDIKDFETSYDSDIGKMAELRKYISIKKIPYTVDFAKALLEDHNKVIIYAYHQEAQDQIFEKLKEYNPVKIAGGDTTEQRGYAEKTFQTNPDCRVFVGSLRAASESITLTAGKVVLLHETDWKPLYVSQAEDRPHRIGQKDSVLVYYLVAEGTIDAYIAQTMIEKLELIQKAIDRPDGFTKEEISRIMNLQEKTLSIKEILEKMMVA